MFSKSELIRFYREVDLNEPFVIYAYTEDLFKENLEINNEILKLEVAEDNLKLKFLPFIFTNFRELQCLSYVESYKDTRERRDFLTCFFDIYQIESKEKQDFYNENWNIIIEFIKKHKNSNSYLNQFYHSLLKNKNKIASFIIDFVMI